MDQDGAKIAPKSPQTGSKCFKLRQDGHQMARERPKVVPRWLKEKTPGWLNMAPRWPKMSPQRPRTFNCFSLPLQTLRSERPPSIAAAMQQLQHSKHCRPPRFLRPFPALPATAVSWALLNTVFRSTADDCNLLGSYRYCRPPRSPGPFQALPGTVVSKARPSTACLLGSTGSR